MPMDTKGLLLSGQAPVRHPINQYMAYPAATPSIAPNRIRREVLISFQFQSFEPRIYTDKHGSIFEWIGSIE